MEKIMETNATPLFRLCVLLVLSAILFPRPLAAQDDVANIPSQDLRAGNNEKMRYFLIGPQQGTKAPEEGFGLVIVLPGGDGGEDFNPFVKRIYMNALPENYLVAQPVAVKWTAKQAITWPTEKNKAKEQKFSTEEFISKVIDDVAAKHKLNPEHIFTLSWSSGGPAAYAISLSNKKVTGSFVAMSVFKAGDFPSLDNAKGRAYYLYHSPDDRTCPIRFAKQAVKDLENKGANVKLAAYEGGHGWRGDVFGDIRAGIEWLEKNNAVTGKK
jgi:predicted esterase